jgi:hypothetical protein
MQAPQTGFEIIDDYDSLADMWTMWNRQYFDADFPRLIIRFEDTLYHLEEVFAAIRDCAGLPTSSIPFTYELSAAKKHGKPSGFVESMKKYASVKGRHTGLTVEDREYVQSALDPTIMKVFGYKQATLQVPPSDLEGPYVSWTLPKYMEDEDIRRNLI